MSLLIYTLPMLARAANYPSTELERPMNLSALICVLVTVHHVFNNVHVAVEFMRRLVHGTVVGGQVSVTCHCGRGRDSVRCHLSRGAGYCQLSLVTVVEGGIVSHVTYHCGRGRDSVNCVAVLWQLSHSNISYMSSVSESSSSSLSSSIGKL